MLTGKNLVAKSLGALSLVFASLVSGCTAFVPVKVPDSVIASCVRSQGFPNGTQYAVEEVFRTDGMNRRVLPSIDISPDQAHAINRCVETQVMGNEALPMVAGVPQRVTVTGNGATMTETFTYGTPPARQTAVTTRSQPHTKSYGYCLPINSVMQRGTGYCIGN